MAPVGDSGYGGEQHELGQPHRLTVLVAQRGGRGGDRLAREPGRQQGVAGVDDQIRFEHPQLGVAGPGHLEQPERSRDVSRSCGDDAAVVSRQSRLERLAQTVEQRGGVAGILVGLGEGADPQVHQTAVEQDPRLPQRVCATSRGRQRQPQVGQGLLVASQQGECVGAPEPDPGEGDAPLGDASPVELGQSRRRSAGHHQGDTEGGAHIRHATHVARALSGSQA